MKITIGKWVVNVLQCVKTKDNLCAQNWNRMFVESWKRKHIQRYTKKCARCSVAKSLAQHSIYGKCSEPLRRYIHSTRMACVYHLYSVILALFHISLCMCICVYVRALCAVYLSMYQRPSWMDCDSIVIRLYFVWI